MRLANFDLNVCFDVFYVVFLISDICEWSAQIIMTSIDLLFKYNNDIKKSSVDIRLKTVDSRILKK